MANVIKIPNRLMAVSRPTSLVFAQSGYYTPTRDCIVRIHLLGGGGGGANGGFGPSYYGAGGGYVQKNLRVKGGVSYNVTVGAGGAGGGQTTNQPFSPFESLGGTAGGNTSVTHHSIEPIIAFGGGGATNITSGPSPAINGAIGGWGSGGDIILQGGHGTNKGASGVSGKYHFAQNYGAFQAVDIAGQQPLTSGGGGSQTTPASPATSVGPGGLFLAAIPSSPGAAAGNRGGFGCGGSGGTQGSQPGSPSITVKAGGGPGGLGLVVIEEL